MDQLAPDYSKQVEEVEREDGFTTEDILSPEFERWCRL